MTTPVRTTLLFGLFPFAYVVAAMAGINSTLIWPVVLIGLGVILVLFRSDREEESAG